MKRVFVMFAASLCAAVTWADVTLPGWMTSNMVLQQKTKVHLQATAKKGATVKITPSWDKNTTKVVADKETGAFEFDLRVPMPERYLWEPIPSLLSAVCPNAGC